MMEQQREAAARGQRMKILVVSDSHGDMACLRYAIGRELPFDMMIHCGDVEGDLEKSLGPGRDYDLKVVRGNCDFGSSYPAMLKLHLGFYNIVVVHGDHYNAMDPKRRGLKKLAREQFADVVCYGHTHIWDNTKEDGVLYLNPGSVSRPRMQPDGSRKKTYAVLTISEDEEPRAEIREMPDYIRGMRGW